jgi:hypothetical protein
MYSQHNLKKFVTPPPQKKASTGKLGASFTQIKNFIHNLLSVMAAKNIQIYIYI